MCGTAAPEAFASECDRPECPYRQSEYDRLKAQRDAILIRQFEPVRRAADRFELMARMEELRGGPEAPGNASIYRKHRAELLEYCKKQGLHR